MINTKESSIAIIQLIDIGGRIEQVWRMYNDILEHNKKNKDDYDSFHVAYKSELLTTFKFIAVLERIADCVSYEYQTLSYYKLKKEIEESFK